MPSSVKDLSVSRGISRTLTKVPSPSKKATLFPIICMSMQVWSREKSLLDNSDTCEKVAFSYKAPYIGELDF